MESYILFIKYLQLFFQTIVENSGDQAWPAQEGAAGKVALGQAGHDVEALDGAGRETDAVPACALKCG